MRAKVSTRRSAKIATVALCGAMLAGCMPGNLACARLSSELERVEREGGVRQSGIWTNVSPIEPSDRSEIVIAREREGDFPYYYNVLGTRECLGEAWSEAREESVASDWKTPATRFSRAGHPDVVVFEDVMRTEGEHRMRSQVVIQARSP